MEAQRTLLLVASWTARFIDDFVELMECRGGKAEKKVLKKMKRLMALKVAFVKVEVPNSLGSLCSIFLKPSSTENCYNSNNLVLSSI